MWWYLLILLPVAMVLWLLYEWYEHSVIQYTTTEVECQKISSHQPLRICLISDLHNNHKRFEKLLAHIREFRPEVILLAGDLVDKHKKNNLQAQKFLQAISSLSIPVFYAPGNHELSLSEKYPDAWESYINHLPSNVCFLENRSVLIKAKNRLCISGLALDRVFYKKGKLHDQAEDLPDIPVPENEFHILIAHHPEYVALYKKYRADFIVSGHLHGGLLRLPGIGGMVSPRLCLPEYDAGLIKGPFGQKLFVSRGLGSHTIPLRFFNRVEVNFLILKGTET